MAEDEQRPTAPQTCCSGRATTAFMISGTYCFTSSLHIPGDMSRSQHMQRTYPDSPLGPHCPPGSTGLSATGKEVLPTLLRPFPGQSARHRKQCFRCHQVPLETVSSAEEKVLPLWSILQDFAGCLPALLGKDALGANGSVNLADLLCGPHQQRGA